MSDSDADTGHLWIIRDESFVGVGDTVALILGPESVGEIIGVDEGLPRVRLTGGSGSGSIRTIAPGDMLLRRAG